MRLIDAAVLMRDFLKDRDGFDVCVVYDIDIQEAPTIDAVPVVRCEDCKHYKPGKHFTDICFCQRLPYYAEKGGLNTADDDFCSYGEKRGDI